MTGDYYTATSSVNQLTEDADAGLISSTTSSTIILADVVVSSLICPLGIVFNIIGVVVFAKLGFKDCSNVPLVCLSVSDICILLTLLGSAVNFNPLVLQAASSYDITYSVSYLIIGWPNALSTRAAGCLTTFLAFQRFLCVAFPLRVKTLVTNKTSVKFTIILILSIVLYAVPVYVANNIGPRFNAMLNQTTVGLIISSNRDLLEGVSLVINITIEIFSFVLTFVFTIALVISFVHVSRWRQQTTSGGKNFQFTTRDRKLIKMVLLISVVFIGCSLPAVVADVAMLFFKEYSIRGRERHLFLASFSIFSNISAINATVNIFICLKMSSKFRHVFRIICSFGKGNRRLLTFQNL